MSLQELLKSDAVIIDVRTSNEYLGGHAAASKNIPLQQLQQNLEMLKSIQKPIVLCCASGTRSDIAAKFLNNHGINAVNAGSWLDVNNVQSQKSMQE
ncbi:MAG TPA: rhodanese-like domain-containing protein [Flavobacteriaceae bacterium]|nr:rhodanese-like domain-containing protein [Flavobacteriaceae bacterium]